MINHCFSDLEQSDFRRAAQEAKNKIQELSVEHSYFYDDIASAAVLLNPQIEDYELLLNKISIKTVKRLIKSKMKKFIVPNQDKKDSPHIKISPPQIEHFKKKIEEEETSNKVQNAPL